MEEVQHSTNICVVVVSEPIHMTVSVTISTVGGTARGIVTVTIFGVVCISNDNNIIIMIINVNGMYIHFQPHLDINYYYYYVYITLYTCRGTVTYKDCTFDLCLINVIKK